MSTTDYNTVYRSKSINMILLLLFISIIIFITIIGFQNHSIKELRTDNLGLNISNDIYLRVIENLNYTIQQKDKEIFYYSYQLKNETKLKEFYIGESIYYRTLENNLAINPRYSDVKRFLRNDKTDTFKWDKDTFDCTGFANTLVKNALKNNIHMCTVEINWLDGGHMIVAVNTFDKGLIYIEPQSDNEIKLHLGKGGHSEFPDKTVISFESCFERIMS